MPHNRGGFNHRTWSADSLAFAPEVRQVLHNREHMLKLIHLSLSKEARETRVPSYRLFKATFLMTYTLIRPHFLQVPPLCSKAKG